MRQIFFVLLFNLLSQVIKAQSSSNHFSMPANTQASDYLPNTVIIKLRKPVQVSNKLVPNATYLNQAGIGIKIASATINNIVQKFPVVNGLNALSISQTQAHIISVDLIYELKYTGYTSIETVINELLQNKNIEYAEPEYVYRKFDTPNDTYFNTAGQYYISQVMAPQAWDIQNTAAGIIIALVDGGSDFNHEDIKGNFYFNSADMPDGTDNDHDGFVDNYLGWDFAGAHANNLQQDNDPSVKSDSASHGVHVSGLASAVTNNGIGVASIARDASLMIVKVMADDDHVHIYNGYDGIKYAADHGARIINCSWGGSQNTAYGQDIINYAINKGCLIVAAAGNDGTSVPQYPAAYKGVLAVANVQNSDIKHTTSNYGTYISLSAPGTNILSTFYNNTYGVLTGTSMSAPIVSSAAALVSSRFPTLTMEQVGQRLRISCDNIDYKNPGLQNQLGSGRLNIYQALTKASPAIRNQKTTWLDKGDDTFSAGDTVLLYLDLKNLLDPVTDLNINLSCANPAISVLDSQVEAGSIGTLETKTMIGPFKIYVHANALDNLNADFLISYSSAQSRYQDFETFTTAVNLDYINIQVNNIGTSITSNGRVGYSSGNATNGLGFIYKNENYLYEASLMIGNSATSVSNNASNGTGSNDDFVKRVRVKKINPSKYDFEGASEFDDSKAAVPLNIYIKHRQMVTANTPGNNFSIAEYEVFNRNNTAINNLYIGLFTDWDVDANLHDVTRYDPVFKMGYVYGKFGNTPYFGVKLLSNSANPVYYPVSSSVPGDVTYNGFSETGKFQTLSNGIKSLELGENSVNGYDVAFTSGYGPYNIPANGSVKVAFALLAGTDVSDLQASATASQNMYLNDLTNTGYAANVNLWQNYPNPVQHSTSITFAIPAEGHTSLEIYNLIGKKISTLLNHDMRAGQYTINADMSGMLPGVYIYRLCYNQTAKARKMIVAIDK